MPSFRGVRVGYAPEAHTYLSLDALVGDALEARSAHAQLALAVYEGQAAQAGSFRAQGAQAAHQIEAYRGDSSEYRVELRFEAVWGEGRLEAAQGDSSQYLVSEVSISQCPVVKADESHLAIYSQAKLCCPCRCR